MRHLTNVVKDSDTDIQIESTFKVGIMTGLIFLMVLKMLPRMAISTWRRWIPLPIPAFLHQSHAYHEQSGNEIIDFKDKLP